MKTLGAALILLLAVACDYGALQEGDLTSLTAGDGSSSGSYSVLHHPLTSDGSTADVDVIMQRYIQDGDVVQMLSDAALAMFVMPGDLSCDGVDDNGNGVTDEDCEKYLEESGDAQVYPGYFFAKSPRYKFKGYYWVGTAKQ